MCVIVIGRKVLPTVADIKKMWDKNADGAGVMWNDGEHVHYVKGFMKLEHLVTFFEDNKEALVKQDMAIHFRLSSIGEKGRALTHPFLVAQHGGNPLEYSGINPVLCHNGHDVDAIKMYRDMAIMKGLRVPMGAFSDSRAIGIIAACNGPNICQLFSGKFCYMTPKHAYMYGKFEVKEGLYYSNDFWESKAGYYNYGGYVGHKSDWYDTHWWNPETRSYEEVEPEETCKSIILSDPKAK